MNKKNSKLKRIVALIGVVILFALYLITLVAAITAKPYANRLFVASVFCSLAVPVLIYGILLVSKVFGKKEGEMSLREFRKAQKEMKAEVSEDQEKK